MTRRRRRNSVARDLRTPKYRKRVIGNKRKQADKRACRKAVNT